MSLAHLALLTLCAWLPGDEPAELVARLSSSKQAEWEEAAGRLEERGRPALPALYRARESSRPEVLRRVDQLIDLIERQRLLRATMVKLDFDGRPLSEVVAGLRERTGFPLVLEGDDARKGRKVTLRAPGPVPFWTALEQLHAAGGLRYNPGPSPAPAGDVPLVLDDGPPPPTDQVGPFRVTVARISRHDEVTPTRVAGKAQTRSQSSLSLLIVAEPGLTIQINGPIALTTAIDDQGQDLRSDALPQVPPRMPWFPRPGVVRPAMLSYEVPLKLTDRSGRRIKQLAGFAPITVVAATEPLLTADLAGAPVGPVSAGGLTLKVNLLRQQGPFSTVELVLGGMTTEPSSSMSVPIVPVGEYQPPFRLESHLRVVDDQGTPLNWHLSSQQRTPQGEMHLQLTLTGNAKRTPARVQYHNVVGVATEVAFEFSDLPLP